MSETFCPHCGGLHHPGTGSCPESLLAGHTLPDGLRVLARLGEIALGELYLAEYLDSHVEVELLIIPPEARGSEPAAEAAGRVHLRDQLQRAAALIEDPNVASVCAIGETKEGAFWATFEVLQGKLLSEIISAGDVLPPSKAIDLVLQAASGLQAAHKVGLIHGNLSPDSILVTRTADNRPLVKLIRFGVVHVGAEPSAGAGESTTYAAPERLTGPPDERSDVFSLGAVLQRLLTRATPSAKRAEALPISEATRRVLAKALEPAPDDRFQTVAAFARALGTATSRPPALVRSGARRAGRLGGVLAAAVVGAIAMLLLWRSTERSKLGDGGDASMAEPITTGEVRAHPSASLDSTPMVLPESRPDSATDPPPASPPRRGSVNSGSAAASTPPLAVSAASDSLLVDLRSVDSTIQVDLRYATPNNFTGAPLPGYEATRALLRREAAAALGRVQAKLRIRGLGLRVLDAYRPVRATLAMVNWAERTGHRALLESGYIAERSRHNLGVAVDLTLVDLGTSIEVPMGTTFDNFTISPQMANAEGEALRNRQILAQAMTSEGFSPYGQAWWHFNYPLEGAVPLDHVIR